MSGGVTYTGRPLTGEQQAFLAKINAALAAHGVTKVNVISGYRSPSYNASVGGASRSNHTTGEAMDATAYVPGQGWIPLGTLLMNDASKYGLRSGAADPNFFHGAPDPNHVDDGANQGGVSPAAAVPVAAVAAARGPSGPVPSSLIGTPVPKTATPIPVPVQAQAPTSSPGLPPALLALLANHTPPPAPVAAPVRLPQQLTQPVGQDALAAAQQHVIDTGAFQVPTALRPA